MKIGIVQQLLLDVIDQRRVAFEQKVHGELGKKVGNVFVGWNVVHQGADLEAIENVSILQSQSLNHPA